MRAALRSCPACLRHVRVSEPACPFCGGEPGDAFRSAPSPRAPAVGRLSRAALFAIGAAGLIGAEGCSAANLYGGTPCVGECLGREADAEPAADGATDVAAGDTVADGATDVQSAQGDAAADAEAHDQAVPWRSGMGGKPR